MTDQLLRTAITLLIVDDAETDRATYSLYLQSDTESTYRIIEAATLEEGLELCRSRSPNIVLLDLSLPDGDGLEFLETINIDRVEDRVPVIMLTGQGNEKTAVSAMKLGAADYLLKGDLTAKLLTTTVNHVLRETALSRQLWRSQQQQILTSEIALRIREFTDLNDIANAIVKEVRQFISADRATIYKFNPADMSSKIVAEDIVSPWRPCLNVQVNDTCFLENLGGAYCEGRIFVANDIYAANLTACHIQLLERFQVRANLVVPILLPNANKRILWGLLILHQCAAPRIWLESDVQLIQQLAVQLSISIKQAIAYQQLQTELTERHRVEALLLNQREALEDRNELLEKISEELQCTVEELRVITEEQIEQHRLLQCEEERYQNLFNFAPNGYLVTDLSGKILEANQAILELLAISREFVVERPLVVFVTSDNRDFFYTQLNRLSTATYAKTTWEITLRNHQRDPFPAEITVTQNINLVNNQPQLFWMVRDISDRKRAEQALQQLNQSLETKVTERTQEIQLQAQMLEQIHDAVISTTMDGTIQTWNIGAERLYEYKSNEAIGQNVSMLYLEEDLPIMEPEVFRPLMRNGTHEVEIQNRTKSGKIIYIGLRLSLVRDALGNPIRLIGCSDNISDRKQAEKALKESERLFSTLVSTSPVAITRFDRPLNCIYVNERWCEMTGRSAASAMGRGWLDAVHPDEQDMIRGMIEHEFFSPSSRQLMLTGEGRHLRPDGTINWCFIQLVKEFNESGKVTGYIGSLTDIGDRKQAENALRESQVLLQTVLDAFPLSVFWKDRESVYLGCNQFFAHTTSLNSVQDIVGKTDLDFSNSETQVLAYRADDLQVIESGIAKINFEEMVTTPTGEQIWVQTNKIPLRNAEGNVIGVMGTFQDISDRKRAELALAQKEQQFQELANASPSVIYSIVQSLHGAPYFEYISPAAEKIHELTVAEAYQNSAIIFEQMHPDDLQGYGDAIEQSLKTLQPFSHEWRIITNSGTKWLRGNSLPSQRKNGDVVWQGVVTEISDRKQAELELQKTTDRLALALKSGAIGYWEWNIQQNIGFWDDRMYELYGLCKETDSQIVCEIWSNSLHPDDLATNEMLLQQIATGQIDEYDTEFRVVYPDGSIHFNKAYGKLERDADGKPLSITGINFDISDRKQTEIALQSSEDRFRRVFDSSVVGMLFADFQGNIIDANDRFLEMVGYTREDFQTGAIDWLAMTPPEYIEQDYASMEYLLKHRQIAPWEKEYYRKDGSRVSILIGAALLQDKNNETICVILDISDRKNAEAVLRESDQRWQFALESVGDGIWDWNTQTNEVFFSQQWKALMGYADDEIENKFESWENLAHPDDIAQSYADINKCLNRETLFYENEHRLRCKDGSYKWILARGKVFEWDVNGRALRMMGTHTDLSDRKQAEAQLKHINEELLLATRLKDEFLANMSHELRTPLNSILGMSESLKEEVLGSLNERQLKAISTVESSGEHLLSLINDILDLSKISSGMMELYIESVSVKNLCSSSLVFVKQQAFNKRIQIYSHIPTHINNINIDERRIKQVLINLLTNSVKFTPNEGNISLLVAIGSGDTWQGEATIPQQLREMNSPRIVFQVVDTGIGIAPNDLPRLFQPFIQVDSALNRQYEGTGLGLALVKQIVELHDGQVMAESEVGKGSRFSVVLPYDMSLSSASESEPTATTSLPQDVNPENAIAPLILLAEDNEANIQTFTSYLTAVNYRIIVAKNGEDAVAMAKANSPDIILMDIQMPIMDGIEATKQIRLDLNLINTPIIALTALAMEGDQERCLAAGANSYIAKPVKLRQLNFLIQQALETI
nr:PAS domain S-box protein [Pseudanabaena sp. BC1403]